MLGNDRRITVWLHGLEGHVLNNGLVRFHERREASLLDLDRLW
jgi:hypothetical protein